MLGNFDFILYQYTIYINRNFFAKTRDYIEKGFELIKLDKTTRLYKRLFKLLFAPNTNRFYIR